MKTAERNPTPSTTGMVLHWAARYDLLVWLLTFGRERALRETLLRPARLEAGESVLDVGCGTGTLAIAARLRVGPTGTVDAIDPSPEMIARAKKKAGKAGVDVAFNIGLAEALPFPDAHFDAVLSTLMLHHLRGETRQQCAREMRRVLKRNGRVLAVDIATPMQGRGFLAHLHRHGHLDLPDITGLLSAAGLNTLESGPVGFMGLQFVLAAPAPER